MPNTNHSAQRPLSSDAAPGLPLWYRKPVVLRFEEHKDKALAPQTHYRFAASSNAVPISVGEFMPAIRNYPIVFAEGSLAPVAILGLKQAENLFIEPNGVWREGAYVPAYLRRYPFILTQAGGTNNRALTIDESSDRFVDVAESDSQGRLFTEDGTATPMAKDILKFCEAYHQQHLASEAFVAAIQEADLLVAKNADMTFRDKSTYQLRGFKIIDPERFRALPPALVADWHGKGWLNAIALHLASQQNWQLLLAAHHSKSEETP